MDSVAPKTGDVVIKRESGTRGAHYSVRQIPGAPQVSCGSRETAFTFAKRFAMDGRAAIWHEQEGVYTPLT